MDSNILYDELVKWMKIDTWSSFHSLDEERFHRSLERIFSRLGTRIDEETFEEVITTLINDLYPHWDNEENLKLIEIYSKKAASIASYLHDTVNSM